MGQVFRAFDTTTDRIVALKVLPAHVADDDEYQQRFRREARTAAALNDPHIVPIHGYGDVDGQLYVDMRLIEGRDLNSFIAENGGRLSPAQAVAVVEQVARALDSAHHAGLVHRDVKPSNILVANARDFVYLIDFGIARAETDTTLTSAGHTMGTLAYMAPERFRGTTDLRADVYSLACVLCESLTGRRPYPGKTFEEQLAGHLHTPPPQPSTMAPGIPPAVDEVVARGMAKDPDERYQTAMELARAARAALASGPGSNSLLEAPTGRPQMQPDAPAAPAPASAPAVPANTPAVPAPARQPATRKPALVIAGLVIGPLLALAAVVAVVAGLMHQGNAVTAQKPLPATAQPSEPPPGAPALPAFNRPADLGADCQYPSSQDPAAKAVKPPQSGKVATDPAEVGVRMVTEQGDIGLQLANDKSPCTVNSFISLANQRFFDGTRCHRLTTSPTSGLLQCGGANNDGSGGPGYHFADEYPADQFDSGDPALRQPRLYSRGTLAMASKGPDTNGSQFFLIYQDSELPPQYTVFGAIDEAGLAVLDKIAKAGVVGGGEEGAPVTPVTIKSVSVG
jgi:cyclophilin family peptidyl-prolyl cis-trans isomerase